MIPPLSRRVICLQAPILDREQVGKNTLLVHGLAEQSASVTGTGAQLLARRLHGLVLALELEFLVAALLRLEELPGAVDGPVAEVAVAREAEGARGERVVEEVADESYGKLLVISLRLSNLPICLWRLSCALRRMHWS